MVVIEVFTPVVQRILKHNMVSSLTTRATELEEAGPRSAQPFTFPKIWRVELLARSTGTGVGILYKLGFSCSLSFLVLPFPVKATGRTFALEVRITKIIWLGEKR